MLESFIIDNIKFLPMGRKFELPPNVSGKVTLPPDKIDLWINEHPFYEGVWELTKYFTNNEGMFTLEASNKDGILIRLEKCSIYSIGQSIPGRAADPEDRAKITGIGIQSLNIKWLY